MKPAWPITCCLLFLVCGWSQQTRGQSDSLHFEHITFSDGLPSTGIIDILQDRQGYLWLAAWSGLARYDGYAFTNYNFDASDSTSLTDGFVAALLEDRSGTLWVGTCGGLSRYDRGTERFTRYVHDPEDPTSLGGACVFDLFEDQQGYLWVGTLDGGLSRFHPDDPQSGFTRYRHDPDDVTSLSSNWVNDVYEDRSGTFWIATANGLSRFERETGRFTRYLYDPAVPGNPGIEILDTSTAPPNTVHALLEDQAGTLWTPMHGNGLCRFDREAETFACYRHRPGDPRSISDDMVFDVAEDVSGGLWVGTRSALNRFDPKTETFTRYQHVQPAPNVPPQDHFILSLYVDHAGILWIGAWGALLTKVDLQNDLFVRHTQGFAIESHPDSPNNRHGFGKDDGFYRLDRSTGKLIPYYTFSADSRGPDPDNINVVYEDRSGTLWVATDRPGGYSPGGGGLFRLHQDGFFTRISLGPDVPNNLVNVIYEDRSGNLWLGADEDGVIRLDKETGVLTLFRNDPDNPNDLSGNAHRILEDRSGMIWIGTGSGMNRLDPSTGIVTHYLYDPDNPDGLDAGSVFSIYEDQEGMLWLANGGVSRLDPATGTVTRYPLPEERHTSVICLVGDDRGRLWLSTLRGLARFDPQTETYTFYSDEKGIEARQFANGSDCHKDRHGTLYFNAETGFYTFDPNRFSDNPTPPHVVLTDLRLFDRSLVPGDDERLQKHISETSAITLQHDENELSIDFLALHFSKPEANRYAYRLEPYDADWREAGTSRTARYTNLDPGAYVFRVKAANAYGVWNEEGAVLHLTITPPWWKTPWAYAFFFLGLGLVLYAGYQIRVRRLKAYARELSRNVAERTRELVAEKQKTEEQARRLVELDEAKNRFFANISHEFRTPLTLILGPLQDALDGRYRDDPARLEKEHRLMHRNARRLLRLINQLLDLSRLESGKLDLHPEPGDFVAFVEHLTRSFVPLAERRRLALTFHAEVETLPMVFDPDALEKVVTNLLSNALKFTPEGGKVFVALKMVEDDEAFWVACSVQDTGPGIATDDLARIFDRFQQADTSIRRKFEGSGVGLTLAKELTALHGGRLEVESEVGWGSMFTVLIPFSAEKEIMEGPSGAEAAGTKPGVLPTDGAAPLVEAASPQAEPGHFRIFGVPKILIVEDNANVRAYLRSHLEEDYHVVEAEDGEAGLAAAREVQPDLILSDVMMPRMDGYEMCRLLKANEALRMIPVVMLTAKAGEQDTVEGIESGADDYLAKPFHVAELKARVAHLLARHREMRATYSREVVVQPSGIPIRPDEEVFLEHVLEVVNRHLGDSAFSVDWLVEEVGLSRRQVERKLEAITGETPAEMIRRLRLERATQLLRAHAGTVAEIAYAVGFNSGSHFAKTFRRVYGVSPTQYVDEAAET